MKRALLIAALLTFAGCGEGCSFWTNHCGDVCATAGLSVFTGAQPSAPQQCVCMQVQIVNWKGR
jgi:hypothetical protein